MGSPDSKFSGGACPQTPLACTGIDRAMMVLIQHPLGKSSGYATAVGVGLVHGMLQYVCVCLCVCMCVCVCEREREREREQERETNKHCGSWVPDLDDFKIWCPPQTAWCIEALAKSPTGSWKKALPFAVRGKANWEVSECHCHAVSDDRTDQDDIFALELLPGLEKKKRGKRQNSQVDIAETARSYPQACFSQFRGSSGVLCWPFLQISVGWILDAK